MQVENERDPTNEDNSHYNDNLITEDYPKTIKKDQNIN